MNRHLLVGRLGADDTVTVEIGADEERSDLQLINGTALAHGIGGALAELRELGLAPSEIGIDLLVLAAMIYAADTRLSRATEAQDGWTREIRLLVPVSDTARWAKARPVLHRALEFLTGDRWEIGFRARPKGKKVLSLPVASLFDPAFDGISLFSGGLDSLIGAIDTLAAGGKPLFVSHAGEGAGSSAQYRCYAALKAHYPDATFGRVRLSMAFQHALAEGVGAETSTRGRSFLFFALAAAAGTALRKPFEIKVPENGLIALNVPLDMLRLGALSTRTTHPYYMARWTELLAALEIEGELVNPYWDKTKGEMRTGCADEAFLLSIADQSISCSSPAKLRWQGVAQGHCGYCLPCLIRRASLPDDEPTVYYVDDLRRGIRDTNQAEGKQVRSFQMAIARLKARPDLAKLLIHKPGPLYDVPIAEQAELADVYRRGMMEVAALLDGVRAAPR